MEHHNFETSCCVKDIYGKVMTLSKSNEAVLNLRKIYGKKKKEKKENKKLCMDSDTHTMWVTGQIFSDHNKESLKTKHIE